MLVTAQAQPSSSSQLKMYVTKVACATIGNEFHIPDLNRVYFICLSNCRDHGTSRVRNSSFGKTNKISAT